MVLEIKKVFEDNSFSIVKQEIDAYITIFTIVLPNDYSNVDDQLFMKFKDTFSVYGYCFLKYFNGKANITFYDNKFKTNNQYMEKYNSFVNDINKYYPYVQLDNVGYLNVIGISTSGEFYTSVEPLMIEFS